VFAFSVLITEAGKLFHLLTVITEKRLFALKAEMIKQLKMGK